MRKLHWISLSLVAAPLVLMHACGGDDSTPGGSAGSGTAGKGGSGGSGGGGTGGTATGGSGGATGGSAGSGGAKTDGGGGTTTEGGAGSKADGAAGGLPDVVVGDALLDVISDGAANKRCEDDASPGSGQTCNDFCDKFMATCNDDAIFADAGGKPFSSPGECRQQCATFGGAALCCYITHVDNAIRYDGGTRSTHCTHAAGLPGNGQCPVRQ
jgi:hypothetical protein